MVVFPPAKINLGLRILRKRADGYHDLESCLVPTGWRDVLEVIESDAFSFQASGHPIAGKVEENLCVKAYRLLQGDFALPPVHIYLHKIIPMGAGLGGGSADASFVLRVLNELFSLSLTIPQLAAYAAQLGSDCPFFVQDRPRMAYDTGTTLEDITLALSGKYLVLVYPNVSVSTADAYGSVVPQESDASLKEMLEINTPHDWKNRVVNDFEQSVFQKYPVLASVKEALYQAGAFYASMSGSGSALYGLYEQPITLPAPWKKYSVWQGPLSTTPEL